MSGCASPFFNDDDDDDPDTNLAREVEEADIVKLQDGFLYLANPFTGLRIVDVRDIDHPIFGGRVLLGGRAVELFVRDERAYVFTAADFFQCAGDPIGFDSDAVSGLTHPDYSGSRLWVVDISDRSAPTVEAQFDFSGFVTATRRVGDVIYAAGNLRGVSFVDTLGPTAGVFITSINVADPADPVFVETETFTGATLDIVVNDEVIYVVGHDPDLVETTLVSYVDIRDPEGDIALRDQFRVPGVIKNRFYADEFDGVFRIITEEFIQDVFSIAVALYTYDITDPDNVRRLARLPIISDGSLRAVRFDGIRGYPVTFRQIDPLFVLNLNDPASPTVAGELEVPGFSTHLVPLGDRLLGVGFDDTAGIRPAVALYDVSNPASPRQLSRIVVGDRFTSTTTSEATVDEKALRVIADAGLVLLPFSTFDRETAQFVDSLQLIEMSPTRLREAGVIDHRGLVRRADLLDERVWILSDTAFQTVDITDLDRPNSLAKLDIIDDQELLDAGLTACADSARYDGENAFFFTGGFCGALGFLLLLGMVLGLGGLRQIRWCGRRAGAR